MKVETTREHAIDPMADIITITDFDHRHVCFHRSVIPELITRLQYQTYRDCWQHTMRRLRSIFSHSGQA